MRMKENGHVLGFRERLKKYFGHEDEENSGEPERAEAADPRAQEQAEASKPCCTAKEERDSAEANEQARAQEENGAQEEDAADSAAQGEPVDSGDEKGKGTLSEEAERERTPLYRRWVTSPRRTQEVMPVELSSLAWDANDAEALFDELKRDKVELRYALALWRSEARVELEQEPKPVRFPQMIAEMKKRLPANAFCERKTFLLHTPQGETRRRKGIMLCPDNRKPFAVAALFQKGERAITILLASMFVPLRNDETLRPKAIAAIEDRAQMAQIHEAAALWTADALRGALEGTKEENEEALS